MRPRKIPLGEPCGNAGVKRGTEQVGVSLDDVLLDFVLHFSLVLPTDSLRGHDLAEGDKRNGLVHVGAEGLVVGAAGFALEQLNRRAQRCHCRGGILDTDQGGEQLLLVALNGGRARVKRPVRHRGSGLLVTDQPEFDVGLFKEDRPVEVVRQSQSVGVVGGIAAGGKRPEFARWHDLVPAVAGVEQLLLDVEFEFAAVTHQHIDQNYLAVLNIPHRFTYGQTVEHTPVHGLEDVVEVDAAQLCLDKLCRLNVGGIVGVIGDNLPLHLG